MILSSNHRLALAVTSAALNLTSLACGGSRTETRPAKVATVAAAQCKPDALSADQTAAAALIKKLKGEGVTVSTASAPQPVVTISPSKNLPTQSKIDLASLGQLAQKLATAYPANCTATGDQYTLSSTELQGWSAMTNAITQSLAQNISLSTTDGDPDVDSTGGSPTPPAPKPATKPASNEAPLATAESPAAGPAIAPSSVSDSTITPHK